MLVFDTCVSYLRRKPHFGIKSLDLYNIMFTSIQSVIFISQEINLCFISEGREVLSVFVISLFCTLCVTSSKNQSNKVCY